MRLPTPEQVNASAKDQGLRPPFTRFSRKSFVAMGGLTGEEPGCGHAGDRFIVSQGCAVYDPDVDVNNALEAMQAYLELTMEHWTVMVWDREKKEGWAYEYFGPKFVDFMLQEYPVPGFHPSTVVPSRPAVSRADVALINRHRRRIGMDDIDLTVGWSDAEIDEMVESIRRHGRLPNPQRRDRDRDIETINEHRSSIGIRPMDLSAGWTDQEILEMAQSVRARGILGPTHQRRSQKEAKWKGRPGASSARALASDLQAVNQYRQALGMPAVDMASGWTQKEITEQAESIRQTGRLPNPGRRASLKNKLMR